mmetsp:Transcript_17096/g.35733  ORF Transcript_17096/g.35733 Transcript_17096/m.35733 type:complete len:289 (-) Transcript_17096:102-968(-)|eukprot:CAMPEP_0182537444 /NCGR_PEP_ID=MMETSP1323-20130603/21966_1 /TAXON_ID=236787 /ORGANISM="Florenciella parvula, Strain RCC1693" /LENGTH=288 /DNA_ID=CAMNT_0024747825 /DNA_START=68 /DNA_END=934 /DNA_ORIENTATION=+
MAFRSTLTATLFLALASSSSSAAAGLRGLVGGYNETASGETSYYSSIDTSKGGLQAQLHTLISPHTVLSYSQLWGAFAIVDESRFACSPTTINDVYSTYCWTTGSSTDGGQQCGSYKKEGDCFNREHSWPKSWWGGYDAGQGAQTDLFHIFPTDGYVNGRRSNFPFGLVDIASATYTSTNGAKLGPCSAGQGFEGTCFEPADEFKGELARAMFYLATAYMDQFSCCDVDAVNGSRIKLWQETMLRSWHSAHPVSNLELERNEEIYTVYQHNRNPFIDNPTWVDLIPDF